MVGVTTLSLFLLSLFLLLTTWVLRVAQIASERMEVYAYLSDGADPEPLRSQTLMLTGVRSVRYVSKEEALREFQAEMGGDQELLALLGYNPLPPSLRIELYPAYRTPDHLARLEEKLYLLPGVEEVWYGKEIIARFHRALMLLVGVDILLLLLVGFVVGFVGFQTARMEALARSTQIEIMGLVGATPGMIKAPFRFEGLLQGLAGGAGASLLLTLTFWALGSELPGLQFTPLPFLAINLVLGGVIGVLGADRALEGMLK